MRLLKILIIPLIFLVSVQPCLAGAESSSTSQPPNPEIYLQPELVEIRPYGNATIDVILVNGSSAGILDLSIEYDKNVVEIINVSSAYRFELGKSIAHNGHLVHLINIKVFLENESVEDRIKIARITLEGVSEGKAVLSFSSWSEVYDKNGKLIPSAFQGMTKVLVKAVTKAEIRFSRETISLSPSETAKVGILLNNGSRIHILKIGLEFVDDRIVAVQNVSSPFRLADIDIRSDRVNITVLTSGKLGNNTTVANLTIKGLSKGLTVFRISKAAGYDASGKPVYLSLTDSGMDVVVEGGIAGGSLLDSIFAVLHRYPIILMLLVAIVIGLIFLVRKGRKERF